MEFFENFEMETPSNIRLPMQYNEHWNILMLLIFGIQSPFLQLYFDSDLDPVTGNPYHHGRLFPPTELIENRIWLALDK